MDAKNDKSMTPGALGLSHREGFHGEKPSKMGMDQAPGKSMKPMGPPPGFKGGGKGKS